MSRQKSQKGNFIVQGAILGVAAILVRVLGLLYQMPLTRIIGDMGNGYYSYAYNIYSMVLLISSFSIPIAVSKMVSARMEQKQYRNVQRVFKASMIYVVVISAVLAIITFVLADHLPKSQAGAIPSLRILCPVIILAGILGVLRGYFQGYGTMMPTSFSQILEGIINAVISVLAAYILVIPFAAGSVKHATYGAVGSTLGTVAGVVIGLLFMLFVYYMYRPVIRKRVRHDRSSEIESYGDLFKIIFFTVTPILLSSAIYNICPVIDQTLFSGILESQKIVGEDIAVLQGIYSAKYLKLVSVPVSIASALSSAIIPAITINIIKKNKREANKNIDMALRFIMLIALPCTIGLFVLAEPIMLLFGRSTTLIVATHVLMFGAVNVIFNCISTLTNAVLQGLDNMRAPIIHSTIALVIHIIVCVVFLRLGWGIYALLLATMAFSLVTWILNAFSIYRMTGYSKLFGSRVFRIVVASLEMGVITFISYQIPYLLLGKGYEYLSLAISLVLSFIGYVFFLLFTNVLNDEDYAVLPMGYRLKSLGLKLNIIGTAEHPFEEEVGELFGEEEFVPQKTKKKFIFRKQENTENRSMADRDTKPLTPDVKPAQPSGNIKLNLEKKREIETLNREDEVVSSMLQHLQQEQLASGIRGAKEEDSNVEYFKSNENQTAKDQFFESVIGSSKEEQPSEVLDLNLEIEDEEHQAETEAKTDVSPKPVVKENREQSSKDAGKEEQDETDTSNGAQETALHQSQNAVQGKSEEQTEEINVLKILEKLQKQEQEASAKLQEAKDSGKYE